MAGSLFQSFIGGRGVYIVYLNRRTGDYWQRRKNIRNWRARVVEAKRFLLSPETEGREKEKALL